MKISEAARLMGCAPETLRRWHKTGELIPTRLSSGGTRYYSSDALTAMREAQPKPARRPGLINKLDDLQAELQGLRDMLVHREL